MQSNECRVVYIMKSISITELVFLCRSEFHRYEPGGSGPTELVKITDTVHPDTPDDLLAFTRHTYLSIWQLQTDRQTDTDRQTERQTDRETERQTDRETDRQRERQTDRQTDRQRERQTDGETSRQTERERQTERQTEGGRGGERENFYVK